ncbi:hypothetical protein AVEN_191857-1 [Araneus ventricosus]|uniref:Reverse transcriptase domain-containing protein n=1 Tax=Araneus ventricosus TaxID=182803 RepID=A0A4Y2EZP0_ARAVE|nr:hypothetical protein AVEN_191857-1 [Araneus ventricosus]
MTRTTPELAPPSPNFRATPAGGRLATTYDLACNRPHTRRIFSGIRVNLTKNKQNVLHPHQFGFRESKSINHALRKLLDVIEDAKEREHYVIFISLDIQGVFDKLKYDIIRKELRKLYTKSNISEALEDILSNRKVAIQTSDGPAVWKQTQGSAQGSCTSPLFWNIVADEILKRDWPTEIHLQAVADDFAFVISGRTRRQLEQHTSFAFETFKNWTDKNQFNISTESHNIY